MTRDKLL